MRRFVLLALCVALGAIVASPGASAAVPVVVVDGQGWGHGVGMAQDGAYWMATDGASMDDILDHFYPGTGRGSNTGVVRVVVLISTDDRAVLDFPDGGELRSPRSGPQHAGFPIRLGPGGAATIVRDGGGYRVEAASGAVAASSAAQLGGAQPIQLPTTSSTSSTSSTSTTGLLPLPSTTTTTAAPGGPATTAPGEPGPAPDPGSGAGAVRSPEPVWAGPVSAGGTVGVPARGLRYRGEVEVSHATGPMRVVNELDVEQYLWGLAEVPGSYPPAALQAQVVAARTYALRAMAANGEICDTQRCQVYKGATAEFRGQVDAVNTTLGTTLGYGGRFASAVFSANAAGFSATPSEGFGTPDASHPYLVAAPYETRSPDPWQVKIGLADLARRLGYPGSATSVSVATKGPSGRPVELELDGDAGPKRVRALDAASAMGLRSTMWSVRIELADAAPAAPDAVALIQAQPEDVGAVIASDTAAVVRATSTDRAVRATTTLVASAPGTGDDDASTDLWWLLAVPVVLAGLCGAVELRRQRDA